MARSYLVTGGTGFIGSALVRRLVRAGHRVRVLDNNSRGRARRLEDMEGRFEFVEADIRDPEAVMQAAGGVDAVAHLAFVNGTELFYKSPDLVLDVGVRGMINVLDACLKHGVGDLILASSSEVYQTPPAVPTDESVPLSIPDPLNPRYSYGAGKIISEIMAINYGRKRFERVVIFRPHNVYGPDMGFEHVVPQFVLRMKKLCAEHPDPAEPVPFPIQGTGDETRAFIFIEDFMDGLMRVVEAGEHLHIYHIGTTEELTIRDVALKVAEYFGRLIVLRPGPRAAGGTPRRCPDISRLERLGFEPKYAFVQGLSITARWYVEHDEGKDVR